MTPTSDWKTFHSVCLTSSFFLFHSTKGFFEWLWKPSLTPNSPLSLLPELLISKNSTHGRFFPVNPASIIEYNLPYPHQTVSSLWISPWLKRWYFSDTSGFELRAMEEDALSRPTDTSCRGHRFC